MAESKLNPREQARLEEQKKNRKIRNRYILIGAAIVLMLVLVIFVNSRLFIDGLPALTAGDSKFTVADVNYEYRKDYMQFTQNYGEYLSIFFDADKPLSEQECTMDADCATWDDYFKKTAENNLIQGAAIYKAAQDAGYTLTEENQAEIDSAISNYTTYGAYYGYPDVNGYLAAMYGAGNNEKTLRRNMAREMVVDRYLEDLYNSFSYTDAEKDAYYDEHADSMNNVEFLYVYLTGDDAGAKADEIASKAEGGNADAFRAAVTEVAETEASDTSYSVSSFLSQYGETVAKEDIVPGKVFVQSSDSGAYAVYVTGINDNHYNTVSVRHILIKAEDEDINGEYSEEELAKALKAAEDVEKVWRAGEATEESFIDLVAQYSQDDGSKDNGGLYENIHKGQMVSEFDAFCFEPHQKGDVAIVKGSSASYTGYHLIYFVSADGDLYSRILAEEEMRNDAYNKAVEQIGMDTEGKRTWMWRYVTTG